MSMEKYNNWLSDIKDVLAERMQITNSDVQGFMEVHNFELAQAWAKGSDAETTAKMLMDYDLKRLQNKYDCKTHVGYWDCQCENNYIRSVSVFTECKACQQCYEDMPSSRLAELVYFGVIPEIEADRLAEV